MSSSTPASSERSGSRVARYAATALAVVFCTAAVGWVQFSFDGLKDGDSYFHTRFARELDRHGIRDRLPQAAFSTWSERFSDKDLLFHVLLVPFQRLHLGRASAAAEPGAEDLVTPGKQAAVLLALLLFAALAVALHALSVRWPAFWIVLLFAAHPAFLQRLLPVRPGHLGVALLLVEIALVLRGRRVGLAVVGALHTWAHSSFVLMPAVVLADLLARLLRRESIDRGRIAAAAAGPVFASIVHPYWPNNLHVSWNQLVDVARSVWWHGGAIPLDLFGPELLDAGTRPFVGAFPLWLPALAAVLCLLAGTGRLSTTGLSLLCSTLMLLVAGFLSSRFLMFFFPTVVLLGGRLWSELAAGRPLREVRRRAPCALFLVLALLTSCVVAGQLRGNVLTLRRGARAARTLQAQRPAVAFLRQTAPPDELVFHLFWWDFSILYHFRPDGRYVEALDPVFFQRHAPDLFAESLEAYRGRCEDPYRMLRDDFGARWVFVRKRPNFLPFFRTLQRDPRIERVYEDGEAVIFRVP